MTKRSDKPRVDRVVITITEVVPVRHMWREALRLLQGSPAELVALFLSDDRWHRAATLPFTREISRVSGSHEDFTAKRASKVHRDAIDRIRAELERLAGEEEQELEVDVLPESEQQKIRERVAGSPSVLVVPSFMANHPLFEELKKEGCEIVVIDS